MFILAHTVKCNKGYCIVLFLDSKQQLQFHAGLIASLNVVAELTLDTHFTVSLYKIFSIVIKNNLLILTQGK